MKLLTALSLTVCFFFISKNSVAQFKWLNPKPSGYHNLKIAFVDSQKGFILNSNGDLFYTSDQGVNWNLQRNFPNAVTMDINPAAGTGIIFAGFNTIYITKDNGISWQQKSSGTATNVFKADVVSSDTIFMASSSGKIYRSDNSGDSWQTFNCGISISSIEFINSRTGYAGGSSAYILKTIDGGATWQQNVVVNTSPSNTMAIKFLDINTGYAFREHSSLLSTKDGGITWSNYNLNDDIYSFFIVNDTLAFACGESGAVYRTSNAGLNWTNVSTIERYAGYNLYSAWFIDGNTGFVAGSMGRILKTSNGGNSWNSYAPPIFGIGDLSMPVPETGYATVGKKIYKTTDSGTNWSPLALTVGTNYAEYDVFQYCHFFSADTGIVTASEPARSFKTYDGGVTWKPVNLSPSGYNYVTDLKFIDNKTGFVALDIYYGGMISKTTDAGETWSPVWSSQFFGEVYNKIHFVDEKTGYASRSEKLYKTVDSAQTWTLLFGEQFKDITAIWFVNEKTGFVAGDNALLKMTSDSGRTWVNISLGTNFYDDIYAIKFIDEQVGYLTAEGGAVYKTINGGSTWKKTGNISYYTIPTIQYGQDSKVFFAGEFGSILSSEASELIITGLNINNLSNCNYELTSTVTAVLGTADSLMYEYGIGSLSNSIAATPSQVQNGQATVKAFVGELAPAMHTFRVKAYFKGKYYYSTPFNYLISPVTPPTATSPVIYCLNELSTALTATGQNLKWYTVETGGIASTSAPIPSTAVAGTTSYWVTRSSTNGCESPRRKIDVVVNGITPNLTVVNRSQTLAISSATTFSTACDSLVVSIEPNGSNPINGITTARVWIETNTPSSYVKRHYEISPLTNPATVTGRVTLYFTQAEFDAFNVINSNKLPTSAADNDGISRLLVEKRSGNSSDGSGLPGTYTGTVFNINPDDADIIWNITANRWEISFDVEGFSGFFIKTNLSSLPLVWLDLNSSLNAQGRAVIDWKVQETNVSSYEIQKSNDGVSFITIGSMASYGNGTNNYQFIEPDALIGTAYFRIKQIDKDGRFTYSDIFELKARKIDLITIYPNPAASKTLLTVNIELQNSTVQLTEMNGRLVRLIRLNGQSTVLDLTTLKSGVYLLKFENGEVVKLVKQ